MQTTEVPFYTSSIAVFFHKYPSSMYISNMCTNGSLKKFPNQNTVGGVIQTKKVPLRKLPIHHFQHFNNQIFPLEYVIKKQNEPKPCKSLVICKGNRTITFQNDSTFILPINMHVCDVCRLPCAPRLGIIQHLFYL